jgi:hypothetical protein
MRDYTVHVTMYARSHDEARVVSAQFQLPLPRGEDMPRLLDALADGMRSVNAWAEDNDIIIGHVKGYVSWGEGAVMVSTTGGAVQVKGSEISPEPPCTADVGIASIVFGTQLHEAEERMERFVTALLGRMECGFSLVHAEHHHDHGDGAEEPCEEHGHRHEHDHHGHGDACSCGEHGHHHASLT